MSKRKPLPEIRPCARCFSPGAQIKVSKNNPRIMWVACPCPKSMSGPHRLTQRGAINAWNNAQNLEKGR
jgi:hypothetical protein